MNYQSLVTWHLQWLSLTLIVTIWTVKDSASVLGEIAFSVIGLAYEGISSFLHQKDIKPWTVIEKKTDLQKNQIHHLEDTMIMYGVYNSDTLTTIVIIVQNMQNRTTLNEKTFAKKIESVLFEWRRHMHFCNKFHAIFDHCKGKVC